MFLLGFTQVLHQMVGPHEVGSVSSGNGLQSQGDGYMGLTHSRRSQQHQIGRLGHEGQAGQLPYLALIYGGLEAEIELLQGTVKGQMGQPGAGLEVPFPPSGGFNAQQVRQHLRVGELLLGRQVQPVVQHRRRLGQSQLLQVLPGLFQGHHRPPPATRAW